ncbi:bifunctional alpha,alpha-trehalose-phosphate synthase (UDP-forming)/trehalose-phosphatase [Hymenobacter sp. YC55]|uniref:bifunctional alpha,alpha-trehalose-phosphate synthase (UDP-forming)/trehalose-phosphatase n=1 Tax=Hymenobacter sp. YC55 TaxID=3034019 RepID=UPI0023F93F73|nr:bifunctional alpha,alpha-trehalose-phosphate synthase (UDP-forming)/trehalose-phosphatase [Hymenobacter sp. YC55]MDF7815821.1 bifunctional alpha,alpha-trehalose-phosphate synthase (UDP-forming)/trehalose-phosphatase [Hymenobacter sp. YC55]
MGKTILVSNRLPLKVQRTDAGFLLQPREGGLAIGLDPMYRSGDYLWVGWPGLAPENEAEQQAIAEMLRSENMTPVFLSETEVGDYYEGFSNGTLWPTFHYFAQYSAFDHQQWAAYVDANEKFCAAVLTLAGPDDRIWVHDYELLLLPQLLRQACPHATIGFFLHTPFPSYELLRVLPCRKELLLGLLGADLVGFQTLGYMRHFLSSVSQLLGLPTHNSQIETPSRTIWAEAFPIGIDYGRCAAAAVTASTQTFAHSYREALREARVILSLDRLDYTNGIAERLNAFEKLLQRYPQWQGQVSLVMVVVPSREQVELYRKLKEEIDELVGRINAQYRTINWRPVHYFYRSLPFEEVAAWYSLADIGLVTPIRDGMNLVAKEYVASRTDQRGVLILSERAGAARELADALLINPTDTSELADALHVALLMPEDEQRRRMAAMQALVKQYDAFAWSRRFSAQLTEVKTKQLALATTPLEPEAAHTLVEAYRHARQRLLLLDYDGTLVPFRAHPERAQPNAELLALLQELSESPETQVALVSGRDRHTLTEWFGHLPLGLIAEEGAWLRPPHQEWTLFHELRADWKQELRPVLDLYVVRASGSFIEEKEFSLVWHFRRVDPDLGRRRARELVSHLLFLAANSDLQVLEGDKMVEIRNAGIHKGAAAARWLSLYQPDFVLALGDDCTDEDMFRVLPPEAFTVKVGESARSQARYHVSRINDALELLRSLRSSAPISTSVPSRPFP